ncbi:hypothetical protein [Prevotellamassilia timonensis]|uniref:hypothetical protein n=1 Tax=Prevotellamassilia timonensis TaxID=1852370 RepID=UPI00307A5C39
MAIRKMSAPNVRKMRDQMFEQIPATEELYRSEEIDTACSSIFMSAYCNYPLLVGQKTNLYKCVLENAMDMASEDKGYIGLLTPESIYDDPKGQPLRRELYKRLRYHFQYQNELRLFAEVHHRASLRSVICSIQVLWMLALRMMDMGCVEALKMRMVIGIPSLIVTVLLLLLTKNCRCCLIRLKMVLREIVPSW